MKNYVRYVRRHATLPFDLVTVEPNATYRHHAQPQVPFLPKWWVIFGNPVGLVVEGIHVGNVLASHVSYGSVPAEVFSMWGREKAFDLFYKAMGENHAALEGLFAPFKLGAEPCQVGNIISVDVRNIMPCALNFQCAMFGEALYRPFDDPLTTRFDDVELPDVTKEPKPRSETVPEPPPVPPPISPTKPVVTSKPEDDAGAWASATWEEP